MHVNEVNLPRLHPHLLLLLPLPLLLTRVTHLRPLRRKLILTIERTHWPDTPRTLFRPSIFVSTGILIDWISSWQPPLHADLEDGNGAVTTEVCAFQVEEEGWERFTVWGDGREGQWVGGGVEDVD